MAYPAVNMALEHLADENQVKLTEVDKMPYYPNTVIPYDATQPQIMALLKTHQTRATAAIKKYADDALKARTPRAEFNNISPAGRGTSDQDLVNRLGWNEDLTSEEFARATTLQRAGMYPDPRPRR